VVHSPASGRKRRILAAVACLRMEGNTEHSMAFLIIERRRNGSLIIIHVNQKSGSRDVRVNLKQTSNSLSTRQTRSDYSRLAKLILLLDLPK